MIEGGIEIQILPVFCGFMVCAPLYGGCSHPHLPKNDNGNVEKGRQPHSPG